MIREVKVGDRIVVDDGNEYALVFVIAIGVCRKAICVSRGQDRSLPVWWLPMDAFLDWVDDYAK